MKRIVVFVGPTLDKEAIQSLLPCAEVLPPVSAGDLLRLSLKPGDLVAIIDGFYFQAAAVRHKEILALLHNGVHIWGTASMGAMRAAELAPFGMRGSGAIFHAYCNGDIDGDDEVALLHAAEDMGYTKLTEALVNIRYALQVAVDEGLLKPDEYQSLLTAAATLPFFERTYAHIWSLALASGFTPDVLDPLHAFIQQQQQRLDLKRKDALELIQALQEPSEDLPPVHFALHETLLLRNWRFEERGVLLYGQWLPLQNVIYAYQVLGNDYARVHFHVLAQQFIALERGAGRSQPALSPVSDADMAYIASTLANRYHFLLDRPLPENVRRWLSFEEGTRPIAEQLTRVALRCWDARFGQMWQESMLEYILTHDIRNELLAVAYQAQQLSHQLQAQHGELLLARLKPEKVYAWLMQRWQIAEQDFDSALRDHGFSSRIDCWRKASPFYLLEKYRGLITISSQVVEASV